MIILVPIAVMYISSIVQRIHCDSIIINNSRINNFQYSPYIQCCNVSIIEVNSKCVARTSASITPLSNCSFTSGNGFCNFSFSNINLYIIFIRQAIFHSIMENITLRTSSNSNCRCVGNSCSNLCKCFFTIIINTCCTSDFLIKLWNFVFIIYANIRGRTVNGNSSTGGSVNEEITSSNIAACASSTTCRSHSTNNISVSHVCTNCSNNIICQVF